MHLPFPGDRASWRRRPAEVRLLVVMLLLSAGASAASAAAPMTPQAPVLVLAGLGVLAGALAAAVWRSRWAGWLHVGPLSVVLGLTVIVVTAATPAGEASTAIGFVWVALYAAMFRTPRAARAYVAVIAVALAGALLANPYLGAVHTWALVVLTTAVAAESLSQNVARLQRLAVTDPLTRVLNREGLRRAGERVLASAERSAGNLTVVAVDLDGFKGVNDRHGHAAGDRLLVDLAAAWTAGLRPNDLLARHGGDEFVLVLPGTDTSSARELLARLRAVSPASWSYGLAAHVPGATLPELLREADADLYIAKGARHGPRGHRRHEGPAGELAPV